MPADPTPYGSGPPPPGPRGRLDGEGRGGWRGSRAGSRATRRVSPAGLMGWGGRGRGRSMLGTLCCRTDTAYGIIGCRRFFVVGPVRLSLAHLAVRPVGLLSLNIAMDFYFFFPQFVRSPFFFAPPLLQLDQVKLRDSRHEQPSHRLHSIHSGFPPSAVTLQRGQETILDYSHIDLLYSQTQGLSIFKLRS